jgi:hypothetical protein
MNYLTLDLPNGNLVLSDNSVWKALRTWVGGGTLYSDYYDASRCGDYWSADRHWINIDSSSNYLTFTIEYDFVNATTNNSCLCQIKFDGNEYGIAVTADSLGLNIQSAAPLNHIDCDYSNANIKIDIVANLLTKEIITYIHKDDTPLAKVVNNSSSYIFTKFVIQVGSLGSTSYKLPTTSKLLNVAVYDDNITYSDFSDTINYVNKLGLAEIWANIKNYITAQLLGKQDTLVSGTNIKTVNNQSLLGSGNVTFTPPTFTYDSSTETLTVSNTTATVFNYDSNTETLEVQING